MDQLEFNFGDGFEPIEEIPWMGEEFILKDQAVIAIDKTFQGWHHLISELIRWEIPFAVIPGFDRSVIEVYYDAAYDKEFNDILQESYGYREKAYG
jgi:hypothetical protein